jgi:hypothetical protein
MGLKTTLAIYSENSQVTPINETTPKIISAFLILALSRKWSFKYKENNMATKNPPEKCRT